jgi:hypothetical protein
MKKLLRHFTDVIILAVAVALSAADCVFIDDYHIAQKDASGNDVYYAQAQSNVTFVLDGHIQCRTTDNAGCTTKFVFAMLVPRDWDLANNATVTYKCDIAADRNLEMPMSVIPDSQLPKWGEGRTWVQCLLGEYGVGPNVLDDMEWVVFQTDLTWNITNNQDPTYKIFVRTKTGKRNRRCKIGFFVNHTDDGFSNGTEHRKIIFATECFEVVGGKGMPIDFCNRHFNRVSPLTCLQDDYVTISYLADVELSTENNPLAASDDIYLQGHAVTTTGKIYNAPPIGQQTRMNRQNSLGRTFNLTIWPAGFFGVPADEQIDHLDYYFSNADGSKIVNQSDDDRVQLGSSNSDNELFNLKFECE